MKSTTRPACQTILKLKCWVCGTNPSTLEKNMVTAQAGRYKAIWKIGIQTSMARDQSSRIISMMKWSSDQWVVMSIHEFLSSQRCTLMCESRTVQMLVCMSSSRFRSVSSAQETWANVQVSRISLVDKHGPFRCTVRSNRGRDAERYTRRPVGSWSH